MLNPNSAIERVKNHLAYKLGQTVIEHRHNGGGYIALFKKLYKIKKQHKKEQKIYQQIIQVFPQLKYPSLETCSDYNEALRCKFHLSYMIGEVLIKAYQNWYKGGGFKLKNNIKKANKEFQIFREILKEFKELNGETLKAIQDNKQLFLKEFPRIKNILKTHQDYQPILDNIFHNFNYFIKNFDLIEEWLLSDDFKEKYKKENHPYPSLLDPKKLNDENEKINYHNIPAELAWKMNLPLPPNYEFVGFFLHTSGEKAMERFLKEVGVVLIGAFGYEDGKRYISIFNFLISEACACNDLKFAIGILDVNCQKYDKFCFLLQNKPVLILLRDPIDSLKSFINVRHQKNGFNEILKIDINNTDFDKINDRIVYVHESNGCFNPDTNQKFPSLESIKALSDTNHWMLMYNIRRNKTIEFFRFNKIIYIDMMDIVGDKTLFTLEKLSKILNFSSPDKNNKIFYQQLYSPLTVLLPCIIKVNNKV
ncbi:DUF2972 domain-containing protein, partial [Campylobacter jejuni]|nr:DUF2972 domain-containing protein [Campylobacter jejuni]